MGILDILHTILLHTSYGYTVQVQIQLCLDRGGFVKKLIFMIFIVLNSTCFALEDLRCDSLEGHKLTAKLEGLWLSDVVFSQNSKVIKRQPLTVAPVKSHNMFASHQFVTTLPYPTYSFLTHDTEYIVAFPDEDLRNDEFIGLLQISEREIELECVTRTIK